MISRMWKQVFAIIRIILPANTMTVRSPGSPVYNATKSYASLIIQSITYSRIYFLYTSYYAHTPTGNNGVAVDVARLHLYVRKL